MCRTRPSDRALSEPTLAGRSLARDAAADAANDTDTHLPVPGDPRARRLLRAGLARATRLLAAFLFTAYGVPHFPFWLTVAISLGL